MVNSASTLDRRSCRLSAQRNPARDRLTSLFKENAAIRSSCPPQKSHVEMEVSNSFFGPSIYGTEVHSTFQAEMAKSFAVFVPDTPRYPTLSSAALSKYNPDVSDGIA